LTLDRLATFMVVLGIERASVAGRLEEMNERRHGMVSRVKIAEKERDSLEGAKLEAEQYLSLEREKLEQQSLFYRIICRHAEVK
jgi:structural maintenance of chromosome 4